MPSLTVGLAAGVVAVTFFWYAFAAIALLAAILYATGEVIGYSYKEIEHQLYAIGLAGNFPNIPGNAPSMFALLMQAVANMIYYFKSLEKV